MAVVGRGTFAALVAPGLRQVFLETGKKRPLEYTALFNVDTMTHNPVTDRQISGLGTLPVKPEGSQFTLDQPILGGTKSYTAVAYASAFEVTWEMWRDELYGIMKDMAAEQSRGSVNRQEVQAWSIINNGFSTSFTGFTAAESLFSTAHAGLDGASRANRPSPDVSFSQTGIQNAIIRFENMTDERGLPRLMAPTLAIVSPANKFAAREILGSLGKPYTSDNEINALIEEDLSWMVSHYLTAAASWLLAVSKGEHDLNYLWRDQPIFDSFDDPWTKNAVFTVYQRHAEGYGSWRGVDGSTG